jgi:hypothetical protein
MLTPVFMNARKQVLALGMLAAVATSVPAYAQSSSKGEPYPTCTRTVTPAESEAAHAKYLSGKVDYDEGKHDAAIQQFKQAYAKDCTKHELLVIISRAYEFKSDFAEAIRALETYLERVPGTPDAATHRSRIETLKGKLAEQQRAASAASASSSSSSTTPASSGTGASPTPVTPPPGAETQGHTVYPWIVVGAGVVGVAVGVVLIATTPSIPSNCNETTTTCTRKPGESDAEFKEDQDQAGRGKNQPVIGAVVTGVGGALVVGGLIWHFLEPTGDRSSTAGAKVRPQVGPGYGGLALTGRF